MFAQVRALGRTSRPVSRILWCRRRGTGGHPSRAAVAGSLVRPTRRLGRAALERLRRPSSTLRCSATLLALLRVGFAEPPESPRALVVSYTAVSPLPAGSRSHDRRFAFCGTVPRVTPGGRYPPPCPVESGLSSAIRFPGPTRPPGRLVRRDCQPTGTPTDLRLFKSGKLQAGAHNAQSMDRHPQEIWRASRSMDTCPAPRPRLDGVAVHCSAGCADRSWVTVH